MCNLNFFLSLVIMSFSLLEFSGYFHQNTYYSGAGVILGNLSVEMDELHGMLEVFPSGHGLEI